MITLRTIAVPVPGQVRRLKFTEGEITLERTYLKKSKLLLALAPRAFFAFYSAALTKNDC